MIAELADYIKPMLESKHGEIEIQKARTGSLYMVHSASGRNIVRFSGHFAVCARSKSVAEVVVSYDSGFYTMNVDGINYANITDLQAFDALVKALKFRRVI